MNKDSHISPFTAINSKKLFEQAEIARYSESEHRQYFESQKEYWDYYSTMKTAEEKGIAKGLAKGREEGLAKGLAKGREEGLAKGREEANRETARKMRQMGLPVATIAKVTGLTAEEIETL